jgi:hypothetical protein
MAVAASYPVTLDVDYPERQSRWKTLLRLFLAIPVLIFAAIVGGAQEATVLAMWIAIALRARIPRWLFDFQVALLRWEVRAYSYTLLLTDAYPPFEGDHSVRFEAQYPERLARWKVLIWKFITSLAHFLVLLILFLTLLVVIPIAWFAILFTGRFPEGLHGYAAGVIRWSMRVQAYFLSLTDEFPPFNLSADAGPGGRDTYVISSVVGLLGTGGIIAGIVALAVVSLQTIEREVSYAALLRGDAPVSQTLVDQAQLDVMLLGATDPADEDFPILQAAPGHRFVLFSLLIEIDDPTLEVRVCDFKLKDTAGDNSDLLLAVVGGRAPPVSISGDGPVEALMLFEVPDDEDPAELRYRSRALLAKTIVYRFVE